MTKQSDRFGSKLKQKLDDFRVGILTLDEIIEFLNEYYKRLPYLKKINNMKRYDFINALIKKINTILILRLV